MGEGGSAAGGTVIYFVSVTPRAEFLSEEAMETTLSEGENERSHAGKHVLLLYPALVSCVHASPWVQQNGTIILWRSLLTPTADDATPLVPQPGWCRTAHS